MKPVILLGSGGHARVLLAIASRLNLNILGITDPNQPLFSEYAGLPILGADTAVFDYATDQIELLNGIGSLPRDSGLRKNLFENFKRNGYVFKTLIDPLAFIAQDVELAEGLQIMAGVIIQTGAKIADNSIVNSGAIIEHDCLIGKHVHIAPGAILSGGVKVGNQVHIGTGATVIQGISIGEGSVIGAGVVVTQNVEAGLILYPPRAHVQYL